MKMLQRSKKKEMEGFKDFVKNLETTPSEKMLSKFQLCALEDPVYMSWVAKNMMTIEKFFEFSEEEIQTVLSSLKEAVLISAKAIGGTPYEQRLMQSMTKDDFVEKFKYELTIHTDIKAEDKEASLFSIFKAFRTMQNKDLIQGLPWRLPTIDVVKINKNIAPSGPYELFFDDEKKVKALSGELKTKQRIGVWEHFFTNGNLMAKGEYAEDEMNGNWTFYYPDGSPKSEGQYSGGKKVGTWKEWDRNKVETTVSYELTES